MHIGTYEWLVPDLSAFSRLYYANMDDTVLRKRRKQQPAAEPASSDARSGGKAPDHEEQALEPQADGYWLTRVLFIRALGLIYCLCKNKFIIIGHCLLSLSLSLSCSCGVPGGPASEQGAAGDQRPASHPSLPQQAQNLLQGCLAHKLSCSATKQAFL